MSYDSIQSFRGYRPLADRPKEKGGSLEYLRLPSAEARKLLDELWRSPDRNCEGRGEEFSGDDLPTDEEAQLMCAGCPMMKLCESYRTEAHPSWGIWAGKVQGRKLKEAMEDE